MCGIFAVYNAKRAAQLTAVGLHGIQHRAIDYAGIVSSDGTYLYREADKGIARQVFTPEVLKRLHGEHALGHIRYPTVSDDESRENSQPILGTYGRVPIAIAHNGNLTNVDELQKLLPTSKLLTSMDTEYILRLLEARYTGDFEADLISVLKLLKGSFSLGILLPNRLIVVRDPSGNRPLSIGTLKEGGYCVSSETCAFPGVEAENVQQVDPGTFVSIDEDGLRTVRFAETKKKLCPFELIYYSLPTSETYEKSVMDYRVTLGKTLEKHAPVIGGADFVVAVPDSANLIAVGYAQNGRSGTLLPLIVRSHYVGRSFIALNQEMRDDIVSQKFGLYAEKIKGSILVLVDDSIVRGTTMQSLVTKLKRLGAKAIHVRIACPPIRFPCLYGINTPTSKELRAANMTQIEMCAFIGADSLEFLPLEALKTLSPNPRNWCFACMNGRYWH